MRAEAVWNSFLLLAPAKVRTAYKLAYLVFGIIFVAAIIGLSTQFIRPQADAGDSSVTTDHTNAVVASAELGARSAQSEASPSMPAAALTQAKDQSLPNGPLVVAQALSAAAAIDELRRFPASKSTEELIGAIYLSCGNARKLRESATLQGRDAHLEAVGHFGRWCGSVETLRNAFDNARLSAKLGDGDSEFDLANKLADPDTGLMAPEHRNGAISLAQSTEIPILGDGLVMQLLTMPGGEFNVAGTDYLDGSVGGVLDVGPVRPRQVSQLISAILVCSHSPLCAPLRPYTMLECAIDGVCTSNQGLLQHRVAMANPMEIRRAQEIIENWRSRQRPPG